MRILDRDFWFSGARPTEGLRPNIWDWLGMSFGALLVVAIVLVICGIDLLPSSKSVTQSSSLWPLVWVFFLLPAGVAVGIRLLRRLLTIGWLRQRINESRHYALVTLICYWLFGALLLKALVLALLDGRFSAFRLSSIMAADGRWIAWKSQPVTFCIWAIVQAGLAIFLFVSGATKYSRRYSHYRRAHRS